MKNILYNLSNACGIIGFLLIPFAAGVWGARITRWLLSYFGLSE